MTVFIQVHMAFTLPSLLLFLLLKAGQECTCGCTQTHTHGSGICKALSPLQVWVFKFGENDLQFTSKWTKNLWISASKEPWIRVFWGFISQNLVKFKDISVDIYEMIWIHVQPYSYSCTSHNTNSPSSYSNVAWLAPGLIYLQLHLFIVVQLEYQLTP